MVMNPYYQRRRWAKPVIFMALVGCKSIKASGRTDIPWDGPTVGSCVVI